MLDSVKSSNARGDLIDIFWAGVHAAHGTQLIQSRSSFDGDAWTYRHGETVYDWRIPRNGRLIVVGAGKACAAMAGGLEAVLKDRIDAGAVIVKYDHKSPLQYIQQFEAGHPIPDAAGIAATQTVLQMVRGLSAEDRVFVLISGGASALLVAPIAGLNLAHKAAITDHLLRSGAAIEEINAVRRQLSTVKGGGLSRAINPAQCLTLVISDIAENDATLIGSGPTAAGHRMDEGTAALEILARYQALPLLPDSVQAWLACRSHSAYPSCDPSPSIILADSNTALDAATERARALGYDVHIFTRELSGDAHVAARRFADALKEMARNKADLRKLALIGVGETTMEVVGSGRGGRSQEFALVVAERISGIAGISVLAAGTDGTDGPTDAAGAFVDARTCQKIKGYGFDYREVLRNNDTYPMFVALNDSFRPGPTGTNVRDLVIGTIDAAVLT